MSLPPTESTPEARPAPKSARRRKLLVRVDPTADEERKSWLAHFRRDARSGVPGLLLSGVLHAILLIVMAVNFVLIQRKERDVPLNLGWLTEVANDASDELPEYAPIQLEPSRTNPQNVVPVEPQDTEQTPAITRSVRPVDVSGALGARPRGDADRPGGINEQAKQSIDLALGWLARQQQRDGRWRLDEGYPDAGTIETDTGATALALLAFLGAGHTHQSGDFQSLVQRGLEWLIGTQRPNGDLFDIFEQGRDAHFYAHAQATIALCESLALTGDPWLQEPAQRAVAFLIDAQNPVLGGWKYRPLNASGIGDLSVTGWALMALHTARMAELEVAPEAFLLASSFLDSVQERPGEEAYYRYRPDWDPAVNQRYSMTAEGLLCRQWLGWERDDSAMQRGVDYLLSTANTPEWLEGRRNVYAWYYTAQTLHNVGGERWREWYGRVQDAITSHQIGDGSWHPTRPMGAPLEHADAAGRLYMTVMCVLILETPYRHAPVYPEPASD